MLQLAVKEKRAYSIRKAGHATWSGEAVVFCPRCKIIQTVWISDSMLVPTRKFKQIGTRIFHDCGATQPCRLYFGL